MIHKKTHTLCIYNRYTTNNQHSISFKETNTLYLFNNLYLLRQWGIFCEMVGISYNSIENIVILDS